MKLFRYVAAGLLVAGASLALAAPASATPDLPGPACGTWTFSQATEAYDAPLHVGAGNSTTNGSTVTLKKPTAPAEVAGVEFAAKDLEIDGPTTITVDYALTEEASFASGAIRLFAYEDQDADTLHDTPTYPPAVASALTGTLTLTATGPVGTLGLAYDASNPSAGTVTFSNLKVGELAGKFSACPKAPESPKPGATKPPAKPKPSPTATPLELPLTGPGDGVNPLAILLPIAGALLLAGAGLVVGLRRRHRFTA